MTSFPCAESTRQFLGARNSSTPAIPNYCMMYITVYMRYQNCVLVIKTNATEEFYPGNNVARRGVKRRQHSGSPAAFSIVPLPSIVSAT